MKRIIKLIPITAVLFMGMLSCDKEKEDNNEGEVPHMFYLGHEYVDLGLNVKWATCNVGAEKPECFGDYYAWGETVTKTTYIQSTYKYCNGSYTTMTKYCSRSYFGNNGFTDTNTRLIPVDDVAHVSWGGSWRMPTQADFDELLDNCDWAMITQNSVNGWKVTSRKDQSQSIFLPDAGYRADDVFDLGINSGYWSSSLETDFPGSAWCLCLYSRYNYYMSSKSRSIGLTVRPVCP